MSNCPSARPADEFFVKSFVREVARDVTDETARQSAFEQSEGEIDEIAATENFDKRVILHSSNPMMQIDHRCYLSLPRFLSRFR
jgi:hypothetical protein